MKEFNLEKAIAGAELVTRSGERVFDFHYLPASMDRYCCAAVVDGEICTFTKSGEYYMGNSMYDLFLKD